MILNKFQFILFFAIFACFFDTFSQNKTPLNLETAIELALIKNRDVIIANNQTHISEYALKEAKGNFLPKLNLNANYNRNIDNQVLYLPPGLGGGESATEIGYDNDYRASLNLALPIFYNSNFANKKLSETQLNLQYEINRGVQQSVVNSTKKAYFNFLIIQEVVNVQQSRLTNALEILEDIKKRLQLGTLTEYDLTSAKVQVANAKNNLLEAQSNLLPAENNLKLITGIDSNESLILTEEIKLLEEEIIIQNGKESMLTENSRIKQLEIDIERNNKQINLTKSAYYPTVDLIGNFVYQTQSNDFNIADYYWINTSLVGIQVQFSIFNGTVTKNRVQQAKINKEIAEIEKEYTIREYKMSYDELVSQLEFSRQKVMVQEDNMNLTQEALALSRKRYNLGVSTFLEVNDAELEFTQARLNWLQAISNYKSAFYDYQLLIGKE